MDERIWDNYVLLKKKNFLACFCGAFFLAVMGSIDFTVKQSFAAYIQIRLGVGVR